MQLEEPPFVHGRFKFQANPCVCLWSFFPADVFTAAILLPAFQTNVQMLYFGGTEAKKNMPPI